MENIKVIPGVDLKDCPNCKTNEKLKDGIDRITGHHSIFCDCGVMGPPSLTAEGAIKKWQKKK